MCVQKKTEKQTQPMPGDQSTTEIDKVSQCQGDTEET